MSVSLYEATISHYLQVLPPIAGLVEKAREHCEAKGLPAEALTDARLAPDMWNFAKQVCAVCQHSNGALAAARSGETGPDLTPPPLDFDALAARLAEAIEQLKAATPEELADLSGKDTCFRMGERVMPFTVQDYLLTFALPNFYFHASMAYAILRNQGLEVGKRDFLGAPRLKG